MYQQQHNALNARSRSRDIRLNKSQEFILSVDSDSHNSSHSTVSHCKISQFHLNADIFYREKLYHSIFNHKIKAKTLIVHINSLFTKEGFAFACKLAKNCKQIQIKVDGGSPLALTTEFFHRIFKQRRPSFQDAIVILKLNTVLISSRLSREISKALMSRRIKECIFSQIYCFDTTEFKKFIGSVRGIQRLQGFHIFLSRMNSDLSLSLSSVLLPQLKLTENLTLSLCRVIAPVNKSLVAEGFWSSFSHLSCLRSLDLDFYNSYDTFYKEGALVKSLSTMSRLEELVLEFTYDSSLTKDFASELAELTPLVSKLKEFRLILSIFSIDSEERLINFFSTIGLCSFGILTDQFQMNKNKINLHGLLKLEIGFSNGNFVLKKIEAEHWSESVLVRIIPRLYRAAPKLEKFEFTMNKVDEVSSEFLVSLQQAFSSYKSLQKLTLAIKATLSESQINLIKLLKAIRSNKNLVALDLDLISQWNDATGALLWAQLSETLEHLADLRTLFLEVHPPLSEETLSLAGISKAIKSLSKLENIRLRFGKMRICEKEFIELMASLSKCPKLSSLSLEIKINDINKIKEHIPSFLNSFGKLSTILFKIEASNYKEVEEIKLLKNIQKKLFAQETMDVIAIRIVPTQEKLHELASAIYNTERFAEILRDIRAPSNWI